MNNNVFLFKLYTATMPREYKILSAKLKLVETELKISQKKETVFEQLQ